MAPMKKKVTSTAAPAGASSNPFERGSVSAKVASLLLKPGEHSWDELIEAAGGSLSPRTMGGIIRGLENAGKRFTKKRDPEYGICYKLDKTGKAERLSNLSGPDATGKRAPSKAAAPVKKAASASKPVAKKAGRGRGGAVATPAKRTSRPATKPVATTTAKRAPASKKAAPKVRRRTSRGV